MPAIVWIDRNHARLLSFDRIPPNETDIRYPMDSGTPFLELLVKHLQDASRILIVGPGVSKYRLFAYIRETAPQIARKVVGCESLEHPHDFLLRALAEKHLGVIPNTP